MNNESHNQALQGMAGAAALAIQNVVDEINVSTWLLGAAIREVKRLEGEDMTEASALLQALSDRLNDCRSVYFAQDQTEQLLAALGGAEV